MSTFRRDAALSDYIVRSCTPPDPVVASLVEHTEKAGELFEMMTPVEQAGFLTLLSHCMSPRLVIDVGTFTGLSALSFARGLAPGGRVITCDVTQEWIGTAVEHWKQAGMDDRIEFRLGPAWKTLGSLAGGAQADIIFIDADKMSYPRYYQAAVPLLRSGGVLILDNVLLKGTVLRPEDVEDEMPRMAAETMRGVNAMLAADHRLQTVMLPIADGVTVARKK
ncbi:class I SAM-dependent methyltransferase [Winogradskya consettensis]|uniref:O-methyltransferase n=1 Tax=Winogradskya consettensis TaxID=113560 RepID=A0A919S9Q1_9ACTN|nr:class I SAM-dependent methyltransferase [Actinoplanes consettensis]GIM67755.1 O-methyltransferase [Actinoplanes consettensis]